ncbi:hypothetical protein [Halobacterium jilantaiense]|uniref:hypothetical protein n=1 Tax=Halobacterium jilantaiense TaxID=355548 RepID=UPI00115FF4A6|nr:hypothetical protein [Halobacterium jilantaiense]
MTDDEVLKHKKVPQPWLEHTRHVLHARADLEDPVEPTSGSQSVGVARSSETYGGKPGLKIQVATDARAQSVVPSDVRGVEVEAVEKEDWRTACYYDTPDNITGGLPIEARWEEGGQSYTGWGTAGLPVKDSNGNERLLTADHLWENKPCQSSEGEEATQYTQDFGKVAESQAEPDFALVEKTNSSLSLSDGIHEENRTLSVSGWFPEEAISELVSEGKSVHKMGVTTGKTTGTIDAMNQSLGNGCGNLENRGVVVNGIEVGEGDSGGPMYRIEDVLGTKHAVLVGHTTHATNINDTASCIGEDRDIGRKAAGHAWFHKNNEYDITI